MKRILSILLAAFILAAGSVLTAGSASVQITAACEQTDVEQAKTELKEVIDEYHSLPEGSNFTEESINEYFQALENAQSVYENSNDVNEINSAKTALESAVEGLTAYTSVYRDKLSAQMAQVDSYLSEIEKDSEVYDALNQVLSDAMPVYYYGNDDDEVEEMTEIMQAAIDKYITGSEKLAQARIELKEVIDEYSCFPPEGANYTQDSISAFYQAMENAQYAYENSNDADEINNAKTSLESAVEGLTQYTSEYRDKLWNLIEYVKGLFDSADRDEAKKALGDIYSEALGIYYYGNNDEDVKSMYERLKTAVDEYEHISGDTEGTEALVVMGDVNSDGVMGVNDGTMIQLYLSGSIVFSDEQLALGDVNSDGSVTVSDATFIQLALAGFNG